MRATDLGQMVRGFFNMNEGRARYKTIRKRVVEDSRIDGIHVCQLIAAMLIASIGLNVDSTEAVIGAMLICPLMGSVLAIAYSAAVVDLKLLRESAIGLLVQVAVCIATSSLYFLISPLSSTTEAVMSNTTATVWDLIIAFVGGFAGALGSSRRQEPYTLLAGVAVATSLMPPLCATGYGLAVRNFVLGASGFYEFLINVVFISFGANIVLTLMHLPLKKDLDGDGIISPNEEEEALTLSHTMRRSLVIGSLLLAIPCVFFSAQVVHRMMTDDSTLFESFDTYDTEMITHELQIMYPKITGYSIGTVDTYDAESDTVNTSVVATVQSSKELSALQQEDIKDLIDLHVEKLDEVNFQVVDKEK